MKKIFLLQLVLCFMLLFSAKAQWIPQGQGLLPDDYGILDLSAVDENIIWGLASNNFSNDGTIGGSPEFIIISIDGGTSWEVRALTALSDRNIVSLSAVNGNIAWISTNDASGSRYFYQTTDGGLTWEVMHAIAGNSNFLWAPVLKFIDETRGYYVGIWTDRAGKTVDGGNTWTQNSLFSFLEDEYWGTSSPQNWLEVKGDSLWFGTSKRISRSIDGGNSWTHSFPTFPGNNLITSVTFDDIGYGLAISDSDLNLSYVESFLDHTIAWKSENFGETWDLLPDIDLPLSSITAIPGEEKMFIGVSGLWEWFDSQIQLSWASAYTTDGGISWTEIDRNIPYNGVSFVSKDIGWVGTIGNNNYGFGPNEKPTVFKWDGMITNNKTPNIKADITIAPNPFSDLLSISSEKYAIQQIDCFSVQGNHIFTQMKNNFNEYNFSNLAEGVYIIKIQVEGGVVTNKIVKISSGK